MTRLAANQALAHAIRGVDRARARCLKQWNAWLDATEDRRRAMEIKAEALREVAMAGKEGT